MNRLDISLDVLAYKWQELFPFDV